MGDAHYQTGDEAKYYANTGSPGSPTWVEMLHIDAIEENFTRNKIKLDVRASGSTKTFAGQMERAFSGNYFRKKGRTDEVYDLLRTSFLEKTPFEIASCDGAIEDTGTVGTKCVVIVTKMVKKSELNGMSQYAIEMDHTDLEEDGESVEPSDFTV